jgi:hypothetical protein
MSSKDSIRATKAANLCEKPFPRRCPECGKAELQPATIAYDAEVKHDGRLYAFHIPQLQVNKCGACGEVLFGNVADDQISQSLREHLALLSPEQIRDALRIGKSITVGINGHPERSEGSGQDARRSLAALRMTVIDSAILSGWVRSARPPTVRP